MLERAGSAPGGGAVWKCVCDCPDRTEKMVTAGNLRSGGTASCGCSARKDVSGRKFGRLTALRATGRKPERRSTIWLCRCECGGEVEVPLCKLTGGHTQSCGCKGTSRDLAGIRFGSLIALSPTAKRTSSRGVVWHCLCDCGGTTEVPASTLLNGKTKSCGCNNRVDLTGRRFGRLVAMRPSERRSRQGKVYWWCVCDCGTEKEILGNVLQSGRGRSCGCLKTIPYDGMMFRSSWELYWYMGAVARELSVEYEKRTIRVCVDGETRSYTPDFWVDEWQRFVEVKGRKREAGMKKISRAREDGHDIVLVQQAELEEWCGCKLSQMHRAAAKGGWMAALDLIRVAVTK